MEEKEYKIGNATEFSKDEIAAFKKIVIEAGEVSSETFDGLISKNPVLLFYTDTKKIEAIGALKIPNESYKNRVFAKSESTVNMDDYEFELGWIVCLNEEKGIGQKITSALATYNSKQYATVRKENAKMNHILQKFGFSQVGKSYKSDRGDYENNLYIKDNSNGQ
ncbi:MAG: N-acetyltransferase [Saprospiraceae bacterium]|nr:N-acetyltransferase [Saprospiraceae bacterium]